MTRAEAIKRIKAGLERRSGKRWSVTGGRGTAWGWLRIDAPPAERTWRMLEDRQEEDTGQPGYHMSPARRTELAALLGRDSVHYQGESVRPEDWEAYAQRAESETPLGDRECMVCGKLTVHRFSCPCDLEHPICKGNHRDIAPRLDCAFIWDGRGHFTTITGRA